MRRHDGAWVGLARRPRRGAGAVRERRHRARARCTLSAAEVEDYYEGFSNGTLWPLYHDVIATPGFHREWWDAYVKVNQRFADRTAAVAEQGAVVWVQDYQLQLVPAMLRELRPDLRIGFFLHIPFPPTELFQQLPWRDQILRGPAGRRPRRLPGLRRRAELPAAGPGAAAPGDPPRRDPHRRRAGPCWPAPTPSPSTPASCTSSRPRSDVAARAAEIRHDLGDPEVLFLGVDRLDYTKGLLGAAAGVRRADRGRHPRRRQGRPSSRWRRRRASASRSTASCATRWTGWSAGSTATSAGSAARRSPTCTPPTPARRWRRSTGPPTSWSSRRCATG